MIFHRPGSDVQAFVGADDFKIDRGYVRRFAQVHEDSDFDRVLIGTASLAPEGSQVGAYAAAHTERLSFLVSHRPGFRAPTVAARELATLDHFSQGRAAVHIITGGHDVEQRRDGDFLEKDERYARTDEYLEVVRKAWTATEPFDFKGRYYQLEGYASGVRPYQKPSIPLYFGGSSEAAYRVGAKHADVYALWGEPLAETKQQIESIRVGLRGGRADSAAAYQCIVPTDSGRNGGLGLGSSAAHSRGHTVGLGRCTANPTPLGSGRPEARGESTASRGSRERGPARPRPLDPHR